MRDFNFFEKQSEGSKTLKYDKKKVTYGVSIILLAIIIFTSIIIIRISILKSDISKLQAQLNSAENKSILSKYENNTVSVDILNKYKEATNGIQQTIENKVVITTTMFNDIIANIPQGITFKTLTMNNATIDIQGVCTDKTAIAEFSHNLESVTSIKEVKISSISGASLIPGGLINFTINCKLKDVGNNENK